MTTGTTVRANGIDVHYLELGAGPSLLLLNNGTVSSNPVWHGHPSAYSAHLDAFAEQFRVIALPRSDPQSTGSRSPSGGAYAERDT